MRRFTSMTIAALAVGALLAPAAVAVRHARVVCRDGVRRARSEQTPAWRPTCDVDAIENGVCRFALTCPLCNFATPACLVKCADEPRWVVAEVPVGRQRTIPMPAIGLRLRLACLPHGTP